MMKLKLVSINNIMNHLPNSYFNTKSLKSPFSRISNQ